MTVRPLLLGHRGARGNKSIPENTIASFDQALADGCDGFEFDVRMTGDGEAVVCHDPETRSLTIARTSVADLRLLPRLSEVLERYLSTAFLDIEVKVTGMEEHIANLLRRYRVGEQKSKPRWFVSSFLPESLLAMQRIDAGIPLGLICETNEQLMHWRELPVEYVVAKDRLIKPQLIKEVNVKGKKIFAWTVNRVASMIQFAGWGVDGIISDETRRLIRTLDHRR